MNRIRQYYERELSALREQGKLFSERFPKLAPFLGQGVKDPEVERLLEGFAFISGKLWAKVEDAYPELAEQFLAILAPSYFGITPSVTILQFQPNPALGQKGKFIPRGTEILTAYQGEKYPVTTAYDLWLNPLEISTFHKKVKQGLTYCSLGFKVLYGVTSHSLKQPFRFFLQGDLRETYQLSFLLKRQLHAVYFQVGEGRHHLHQAYFKTLGFGASESLLPSAEADYQSFGLLAEYFNFPEKYLCLELLGFDLHQLPATKEFTLEFILIGDEQALLPIQAEHFQLHAIPVVNLFQANAEPIMHEGAKVIYPVRVGGQRNLAVQAVTQVEGFAEARKARFEYQPARNFPVLQAGMHRYQTHLRASLLYDHPDVLLEVWSSSHPGESQVISIEVLAYQPDAFVKVNGMHLLSAEKSTLNVAFTNLIPFTRPVYPPLAQEVLWQLIAHLSFKFKNLAEVETLQQIILAYDFVGRGKNMAASLLALETRSKQNFQRGEIFYGKSSVLSLQEDGFLNSGEIDLFGQILAEIFKEHAPFNSFHTLTIKGVLSGVSLTWT